MYQGEEPFREFLHSCSESALVIMCFPGRHITKTGFPLKNERTTHGIFEGHSESLLEECLS